MEGDLRKMADYEQVVAVKVHCGTEVRKDELKSCKSLMTQRQIFLCLGRAEQLYLQSTVPGNAILFLIIKNSVLKKSLYQVRAVSHPLEGRAVLSLI